MTEEGSALKDSEEQMKEEVSSLQESIAKCERDLAEAEEEKAEIREMLKAQLEETGEAQQQVVVWKRKIRLVCPDEQPDRVVYNTQRHSDDKYLQAHTGRGGGVVGHQQECRPKSATVTRSKAKERLDQVIKQRFPTESLGGPNGRRRKQWMTSRYFLEWPEGTSTAEQCRFTRKFPH